MVGVIHLLLGSLRLVRIGCGPDSVHQAMEKLKEIWDRLKTSHQKSYVDIRQRDLEFDVDDLVFLKVSPMKGVLHFRRKLKAQPPLYGSL